MHNACATRSYLFSNTPLNNNPNYLRQNQDLLFCFFFSITIAPAMLPILKANQSTYWIRHLVFLDYKDPSFILRVPLNFATVDPNFNSSLRTSKWLQRFIAREGSCEYETHSCQTLPETVEHTISDLFITSTDKVNRRLITVFYGSVETDLTDVAEKDLLDKLFNERIDHWAQSKSFMDVFPSCRLTFLWFRRAVSQSIKACMNIFANECCLKANGKSFSATGFASPWP